MITQHCREGRHGVNTELVTYSEASSRIAAWLLDEAPAPQVAIVPDPAQRCDGHDCDCECHA